MNGRRRHRDQHEDTSEYAPAPDQIREALAAVESHDIPGDPGVQPIRVLKASVGLPVSVGPRTVREADIAEGRPRHGEKRSDDHISRYEVVFENHCPECGHDRGLYRYHAHHHIAGGFTIFCPRCEAVLDSEEWG